MVRISFFRLHWNSFWNCRARSSRRSGCVGASPLDPKSSSLATIPTPNSLAQTRLVVTLAVSGLLPSTSQFARSRRSGVRFVSLSPPWDTCSGGSASGTPDCTSLPLVRNRPRVNTWVGRFRWVGRSESTGTRLLGIFDRSCWKPFSF